jgi:alpha-ketoglutarate-dependent taurine dioxygenase
VPGVEGVTVIWPALQATERAANFRNPGGASRWHTDLVHERQPAGITHLHNDVVPEVGGDTLWASGYAAYEKLSPGFRKIIDGKKAYFKSAHTYLNRAFTTKIVGLDKAESDVILNYLFDVYERVSIMLDREILSNKITNMSSEHRHPAPIQMDS